MKTVSGAWGLEKACLTLVPKHSCREISREGIIEIWQIIQRFFLLHCY